MNLHIVLSDMIATAPIWAAVALGIIVILVNALLHNSGRLQFGIAIAGLGAVAATAAWSLPMRGTAFSGMVMTGGFASLTSILFAASAGLTILLSKEYIRKIGADHGEWYILVLLAVCGMMTFASGLDLIVTFLGLEIMSVCLYVLAGFTRKEKRANEAALKYFLLGAFATGFFLYGIALIYGATGTTNLTQIAADISRFRSEPLFLAGVGLLLIGFAFKVGAVPFHMWVPDVYDGSPTMVSAFMSTGAKASAFAALVLVFTVKLGVIGSAVGTVFAVLAVLSMFIGNLVAISQTSIKRMLAYSSIAHAGYMMVGIAAGAPTSAAAVLYYLVSYTFTNIGAFGIASIIEDEHQGRTSIESFAGLGTRRPFLAALMSIFLFSLVGLPPLSGFFGKYYLFVAAIDMGYTWLAIVGVVTSMISIYFYLRVVVVMYFSQDAETAPVTFSRTGIWTLTAAALAVILVGSFPRLVLDLMRDMF